MAHPMLSFDFGDEGHVLLSIETRKETHESFSAIGGIYKMFELQYIFGDEADFVRVRTNIRDEPCYIYRTSTTPEDAKKLGIANRSWTYVSTRRGEVKSMAHVTDVAMNGVLFMPFHFEEGPANLLTINALDPVAKIPEYKVCAAKIRSAL